MDLILALAEKGIAVEVPPKVKGDPKDARAPPLPRGAPPPRPTERPREPAGAGERPRRDEPREREYTSFSRNPGSGNPGDIYDLDPKAAPKAAALKVPPPYSEVVPEKKAPPAYNDYVKKGAEPQVIEVCPELCKGGVYSLQTKDWGSGN